MPSALRMISRARVEALDLVASRVTRVGLTYCGNSMTPASRDGRAASGLVEHPRALALAARAGGSHRRTRCRRAILRISTASNCASGRILRQHLEPVTGRRQAISRTCATTLEPERRTGGGARRQPGVATPLGFPQHREGVSCRSERFRADRRQRDVHGQESEVAQLLHKSNPGAGARRLSVTARSALALASSSVASRRCRPDWMWIPPGPWPALVPRKSPRRCAVSMFDLRILRLVEFGAGTGAVPSRIVVQALRALLCASSGSARNSRLTL